MPSIVENSYDLAAQHVIVSLELQTTDLRVRFADKISVGGLENCDCVPVQVTASGWLWRMRRADFFSTDGHLLATYTAVCLDPALTPDEDLAAKYRREMHVSSVRMAGGD